MEYRTLLELYKALLPVFNVKRRLLKYSKSEITNEEIFKYLAKNKWRNSHDLTISEIVNDIITLDISTIHKERGK